MNSQMILQRMRLFEFFWAKTARIRSLIRMDTDMLLQIAFSCKFLAAKLTLERLVRVNDGMNLQIRFVLESLAAFLTFMRLLARF